MQNNLLRYVIAFFIFVVVVNISFSPLPGNSAYAPICNTQLHTDETYEGTSPSNFRWDGPDPVDAWHAAYGEEMTKDVARSVQEKHASGYILGGYTESYGEGENDAWLLSVSETGGLYWNHTYGGQFDDRGYSVCQTVACNYLLAGYSESFGVGMKDAWVICADSSGNELWNFTFGGSANETIYSVQQTTDGEVIAAGYTESFGGGERDMWLIKLDMSGHMLWNCTFGGSHHDIGYAVQETVDGGYIIAGSTYFSDPNWNQIWLIKTNSDGRQLWARTFASGIDSVAYDVRQTVDGGYILTGYLRSAADFGYVYLLKVDGMGNMQWGRTYEYGAWSKMYAVDQTVDGGYILAGYAHYTDGITRDHGLIIKTDALGNVLWDESVGEEYTDEFFDVMVSSDNYYLTVGYTVSYGAYDGDAWLKKMGTTPVEIELLILCHEDYVTMLQPLADHKNSTGISSWVYSWQRFNATFPGHDESERIKWGLKIFHENFNTSMVLLVGDCNKFPIRYTMTDRATIEAYDRAFYVTDLYYADLYKSFYRYDNWDGNDNGYYGEIHGATIPGVVNVDEVDISPDIMIGRLPVSNLAELSWIVNKTIDYEFETYEALWSEKALFIATIDWLNDVCDTKEAIITNSLPGFTIERLYQQNNPCVNTPPPISDNINDVLNEGVGFLNYLGHGNQWNWQIPNDYYNLGDFPGLLNDDMLCRGLWNSKVYYRSPL